MARVRLANPEPFVTLQYNPYQVAFMDARRLRACVNGHQWSVINARGNCPTCDAAPFRPYRNFLLRAGRRGGKTRIGSLAVVEELSIKDGAIWWASAPTYRDLEDFVVPAVFKQIPQQWIDDKRTQWLESEYTLVLPNRSMLQFRSLEDADTARGPGLDGWWIDEICKLTRHHLEVGRPMLLDRKGILIGTTTPRGKDWVHKDLYLPAERGEPGYWACAYRSSDNPIIDKDELAMARASMTDLMYRQEHEADIVTFAGAIYGDLVDACVIPGTDEEMKTYLPEWPQIDPSRMTIGGLDPGTEHPFAFCHLVATPRGLVCVGEYKAQRAPFGIHAQRIHNIRRGSQGPIGQDRTQAQAQIELALHGIHTVLAENDHMAGINRVSSWMLASLQSRVASQAGLPRGLVLPESRCPQLIEELRSYRYTDNPTMSDGALKKEHVYKLDDDLADALRYGLMTYPELPQVDPARLPDRRDLAALDEKTRSEIMRNRRSEAQYARRAVEDGGDPLAMSVVSDEWDLIPADGMGDFTR